MCGLGLAPALAECPNGWCRREDRSFSAVFSIGRHDARLRAAINAYKYGGERHRAAGFAGIVAAFLAGHQTWFEEIDVITAVPAYTGEGARRSWDPAGDVLAIAADRLGPAWSVDPGLVVKRWDTPRLAGRSLEGRRSTARGPLRRALALGPGRRVHGSRVLVFDDVFTDGSTMREVARLLRGAGAAEVCGLVLARPEWERDR